MKTLIRRTFSRAFFCAILWAFCTSIHAQHGLLREVYTNIFGFSVDLLLANPNFPNNPASSSVIPEFDAPQNEADSFGQRLRGYIEAPQSGSYVFWIASDDESRLFISTDEQPLNTRLIARVLSFTQPQEWESPLEPGQKSEPVILEQGKRYYIEALGVDGSGADHLAVRWQLPDGTIEGPIPNERLYVELIPPQISGQPASVTVAEGQGARFAVRVSNAGPVHYQWLRNDQPIPDATNSVYNLPPTSLADNGHRFQVIVSNEFAPVGLLSATAFLTVRGDSEPPTIVSVQTTGESDLVTVRFSERSSRESAETAANYQISDGVTVRAATLTPDGRTVILHTTPLTSGRTYLLTVNNIRDQASTPNTIEPDSQAEFRFGGAPLRADLVYGKPEKPGPSSRRTGLVISEIMYNPAPRNDQRRLEYIEIFNSQEHQETLDEYHLAGDISYVFPKGTFIPARSYVVVAANPADVRDVYAPARLFGPYTGTLSSAGSLQLLNDQHAVLIEVAYDSIGDWPAAADGAGPSLVLSRASYGEANPRAWSASDSVAGSPGREEPASPNPYRGLVINEFLAHTDLPAVDFIELFNYSPAEIDLSGVLITDDTGTNKFRVPNGTRLAPLGFARYDEIDLGFGLSSAGERIIVRDPRRTRVIDAVNFGPQANGIALGRFPDGAPGWRQLSRPTPNSANARPSLPPVVINEIMYNPISGVPDEEYVELYNRSESPVQLEGWRLSDGISFTFTQPASIPPGGYFVVARNIAWLRGLHPDLTADNSVGGFNGSLANDGERIALERPEVSLTINGAITRTNTHHVVVNEVHYGTGGRWPGWADGGGSSLELIDPESDNSAPSNWADSDETAKSAWSTIERRGILDHGSTNFVSTSPARSLHVLLMDQGEALADDFEVVPDGGTNLVTNPGLERGLNGWLVGGTHDASTVDRGAGVEGSSALHLRATERGDTSANRIRVRLSEGVTNGSIATLRAKVRWLRGTPEILLRLHGNYLEAAGVMPVPKNLGTPGLVNSRRQANAAPAIWAVRHDPILPAARQDVNVLARVDDPDRLALVSLYYRLEPGPNTNTYVQVPMSYHGAGHYVGTIPGQSNLVTAAFYIEAVDVGGRAARFPASAPEHEGVILFGDSSLGGNLGTYRLWVSGTNIDRWTKRERSSNKAIDATFVYNNERVVYNMGTLYSGSPFHWGNYNSPIGNSANYAMIFPDDDRFLGQTDSVLMLPSNLGSDSTGVREQVFFWMADQLQQTFNHRRYHHLFVNGRNRGLSASGNTQRVYEDAQQPNRDMIQQWFPQAQDGVLHKIEDWFEYSDSFSFFNLDAELLALHTTNLVTGARELKQERYRWWFRKRAVRDSAHDYSELLRLVEATNDPDPDRYAAKTAALVDIDAWMGAIAIRHVVGDWDAFGYARGKNMYAYKPIGQKWQLLHWDIAFAFGLGDWEGMDLFSVTHFDGTIDSITKRMMETPAFRRSYYRALYEAAHGPMVAARVNPVIDGRFGALVANGIAASSPDSVKQWIAGRRDYVLAQVANVSAGFGIANNNGQNYSTNRNSIVLTGSAPVNVRQIRINGSEVPVRWTSVTSWEVRLALKPQQANLIRAEGFDLNGQLVAQTSLTVTVTGQNEPITGRVVFNEIQYHPEVGGAQFVEFHNVSRVSSFDLSGYRINGLSFAFPPGSIIPPGGFLLVVKGPVAFAYRYGFGLPVAGQFDGTLADGGEALSLVTFDSTGTNEVVLSAVRYDQASPWPSLENSGGASLQLIDPAQDIARVANWAVQSGRATPGAINSTRATLAPFSPLWLNEAQSQNTSGPADAAGDRDPWLELYNSGSTAIPLGGHYLTDDFASLTQWPFPATAMIQPGERLIIWADGEPGESSTTEWHTSFRLKPAGGSVALVATRGVPAVLDYLHYTGPVGTSFGAFPEAQSVRREIFFKPTPGAPNDFSAPPAAVVINEWMASNVSTIQDPDDLDFDDWFELYNAGASEVNLSGFTLSDDFANWNEYRIPAGTILPAGSFLLIWADNEQSTLGGLHASFRLSANGDQIGLFTPDGQTVDSVIFGPQLDDVSQGRAVDGGRAIASFPVATPGRSNTGLDPRALRFTAITAAAGQVTLTWNSEAGESYLLQTKSRLTDTAWTDVRTVPSAGASSSTSEPVTGDQRFYRLSKR